MFKKLQDSSIQYITIPKYILSNGQSAASNPVNVYRDYCSSTIES